jgi:hypothetical protein
MDKGIVGEGLDHEQSEVDPASPVALQQRVTDVATPERKPFARPSSRSLPRTTVERVSLAKMRRVASTWSTRSPIRPRRITHSKNFTFARNLRE